MVTLNLESFAQTLGSLSAEPLRDLYVDLLMA
jgi:hypothetical protein